MTVEYLDLADFVAIASAVTGLDENTVIKVVDLGLADPALHASAAGFLPDGNKRAAWVALRMFVEINGWSWLRRPDVDEAEATVLAIAAGEIDEDHTADWLRTYLVAPAAD